jgi:hypothetical protein
MLAVVLALGLTAGQRSLAQNPDGWEEEVDRV